MRNFWLNFRALSNIRSRIWNIETFNTEGWQVGSINTSTGLPDSAQGQIVNPNLFGVKTGVKQIYCDPGYIMYFVAYSSDGSSYLGIQRTWSDAAFDCTQYPDLLFMMCVERYPASSTMDPSESSHIHFIGISGIPKTNNGINNLKWERVWYSNSYSLSAQTITFKNVNPDFFLICWNMDGNTPHGTELVRPSGAVMLMFWGSDVPDYTKGNQLVWRRKITNISATSMDIGETSGYFTTDHTWLTGFNHHVRPAEIYAIKSIKTL